MFLVFIWSFASFLMMSGSLLDLCCLLALGLDRPDDREVLNGILYVLATGCRWTVNFFQLPKDSQF
ncbi:hypothetical protein DRN63_02945 [Nanoarchaeota archaeon]|nr:MAG: hypothetical protein DRN63_02945 [Nanoarchaeota archaeon]